MTKKFKHLRLPETWQHYWTRYPQGYTIMEALISWVSQVNEMADNINDWNDYLDEFVATWDKDLQGQVVSLLSEWREDGTLEDIINIGVFNDLNDKIDTKVSKEEHQETIDQLTNHINENANRFKHKIYQPVGFTHRNPALFTTNFVREPLISFVSDDGDIEDYTVFRPLFDSFGWKITLAIQTAYVGNKDKYGNQIMTWDQIHEMYADGHTIAAHTVTHPYLTQLSTNDVEYELAKCKEELLNKGFDVRHIMYPYGDTNEVVQKIALKHYLSGAGISPGVNYYGQKPGYIKRYSVYNTPMTTLRDAVDAAITRNAWTVFYIHGYEAREPQFMDKLTQLLNYIKTSNVKVVPYDDGYDYYIRRELSYLPHRTFVLTNTQNIPNNTTNVEILLPNFDYATHEEEYGNKIYIDQTEKRIVVREAGRYIIDYSLLIKAETNCQVIVSLETNVQYPDNTFSTRISKCQNFFVGDDNITNPNGNKQEIPVSNSVVVDFDPGSYKEFYIYLRVVFRGQSTTKTNQIVAWQDNSRISVTRIG